MDFIFGPKMILSSFLDLTNDKNYNDSNKLLPKRTMCQEIELLLRYNDFKSLSFN